MRNENRINKHNNLTEEEQGTRIFRKYESPQKWKKTR